MIAGGLLVCAVAMVALGVFVHEGALASVLATVVLAVGMSGLIAPPSTVVMNALPDAEAGDGSSLNMVSRFVGAAIGVAIIGSVFAAVQSDRLDSDAPRSRYDARCTRRLLGRRHSSRWPPRRGRGSRCAAGTMPAQRAVTVSVSRPERSTTPGVAPVA